MSAMAQAVLDTAPPRFSLTGFSLGGWVALGVVTAAPERVERFCRPRLP
jgi:pimeloyl-ACP methyl ester carboxylesterase